VATEPTDQLRAGLTLRARLLGILAVVAVLLAGTVGAQLVLQARQRDIRNDIIGRIDPALLAVGDLRAGLVDQETGVRGYALARDPRFLDPYERGQETAADASARLHDLLDDGELADELAAVEDLTETWRTEIAEPSIAATQQGLDTPVSDAFQLQGRQRFDEVRAALEVVDDALSADRVDQNDALDAAARRATAAMIVQAVGLVLSGVLIIVALDRVVVGPIRRLGRDARIVAEGDLDHPVAGDGSPDLVALGEDVDAMRVRILEEVDQLNAASADLARQAEDLARSNADLEQFAYVASHDLQEPLRKVSSFCQLLQKRYADRLDERANEYIFFAVDGAKRMQDLINDLLAFSRVGRTSDEFESVDLNDVVADVIDVLAPTIEEDEAVVQVGNLPVVAGDRRLLGATFQNLISNALKFRGPEPPCVEITATVAAAPAGDEWIITVADNGIGIEPDYGEQIFVIFKRLHTKTEYSGTGIGLALAKKIVEFHGGRIWLADTPGPGSTFCLALPATTPAPEEREADDAG
jgi:signal transduction histidine kinase